MDTFSTKQQVIKSQIESQQMILRIDDIVSGQKTKKKQEPPTVSKREQDFGDLKGEGDQLN